VSATTTLLGKTQARIWTKPLEHHINPLTGDIHPDFTDGPACIAFANDILGITLFPWQEWLLNHALEINDDGLYRFRIIIVMVARQNGKTTVENILALWHMFALESGLVIGTAQNLDRSKEAWKDCLALAELDDELNDMIEERNFGNPHYFNLSNGCEYRVAAASRRGGKGFSGDLILMDELREHQSWDSWSSVTNTMNARQLAQAWAFSNAGDALSTVLRYQRALAHRELGWPDGDAEAELLEDADAFSDDDVGGPELPEGWDEITTGFFEWSAPPGAARSDMDALAWANPSLNHTDVTFNCPTTRSLIAALKGSPSTEYEQNVLCRFTVGGTGGPFLEGSWTATSHAEATLGEEAEIVVCVEVSTKRDATFIARAGKYDTDALKGVAVVGISHDSPGTDWVVKELVDIRETYAGIVIRSEAGAPTLNLLEDLRNAKLDDGSDADLPIIEWSGGDVQAAHGDMFDRLRDKRIEHLPHRGLDVAATSAETIQNPSGGWRVDIWRSPSDTAPLLAAIGACWGLDHVPEEVSMYATEPVFVIQRRGF
jgi:hypothetical protein